MDSRRHDPAVDLPISEPVATPHFSLGRLQVYVFTDGTFDVPPNCLSANAPPQAMAEALSEAGFSPSGYALPIHNLLIEAGDQLVLVDVGYGSRFQSTRPNAYKLLPAMRAAGILPSQITAVHLTHLHPDHAAGAIDAEGQPVFPNARYLVNRVEY